LNRLQKSFQLISGQDDMKGIKKAKGPAISHLNLFFGGTDLTAAKMAKPDFRRRGRGISLTLHKKFRVC
jgi:hypothetical protein